MHPIGRVILHLDMDAFYAAVEVREDPSLAGRPLIIGHRGRRGVVSTCSYEARRFGVHSAMPSVTAERLCPDAVWRPGRMGLYVEVSRRIKKILRDSSPLVEPLSIDEAFLDLTGIARDLEGGSAIARRLKDRIRDEERLTASVGVAPNKFLAKLASDLEKPDGLVVFPLEAVPTRLWPMDVERLWGVGPKTAARLHGHRWHRVGDLANASLGLLEERLGPGLAAHLHALAHGRDERRVQPEHEAKSISEERTYGMDLTDPDAIDRALLARAEGVARDLRRQGLVARTVHIKVRTGDFTTWTRARTLPEPTDLAEGIVAAARGLFAERIDLGRKGVRLLGVGVSGLEPPGRGQGILFQDPAEERARKLSRAADAVRERFGADAIQRARLLKREEREEGEASSPPAVD
ncbi:MAG: DNA polymerase IV [Acidobacteriota bacterium]|jgi:nucleotidyltransferase/DNA polymerase involved in DNA repair